MPIIPTSNGRAGQQEPSSSLLQPSLITPRRPASLDYQLAIRLGSGQRVKDVRRFIYPHPVDQHPPSFQLPRKLSHRPQVLLPPPPPENLEDGIVSTTRTQQICQPSASLVELPDIGCSTAKSHIEVALLQDRVHVKLRIAGHLNDERFYDRGLSGKVDVHGSHADLSSSRDRLHRGASKASLCEKASSGRHYVAAGARRLLPPGDGVITSLDFASGFGHSRTLLNYSQPILNRGKNDTVRRSDREPRHGPADGVPADIGGDGRRGQRERRLLRSRRLCWSSARSPHPGRALRGDER